MFIRSGRVIYSPSDLIVAATCQYAFLRDLDHTLGRGEKVNPPPDAMLQRAISLGETHEESILREFVEQYGPWDSQGPGGVAEIARPDRHSPAGMAQREQETVAALQAGADVVFQATFFDDREIGFVGFADFIVKDGPGGRYTVYDTKLARQARVSALLQLAAYADELLRLGFDPAPEVALILGTRAVSRHRLADLLPVYREQRALVEDLIASHQAASDPIAWGGDFLACGRCPSCDEQITETRDVLTVSGLRIPQRKKLHEAEIFTINDLAEAPETVAGLSGHTVRKLRSQAQLQLGMVGEKLGDLRVEIFSPQSLQELPPPDPGDLFFDFEGDPLYEEDGVFGIEYLFGFVSHETANTGESVENVARPESLGSTSSPIKPVFHGYWADSREEEGEALDRFVTFVQDRRRQYPGMRIYHYANYEKTALTHLAAQHGRHEETIDQWLRSGLLVDLYPIVTNTLRSSAGSLGLKALEPLYMGDDLREESVTTAADSVVAFAEYCVLRDGDKTGAARELKQNILAYNEYDCVSTMRLRDWLLEKARHYDFEPAGELESNDPDELPDAAQESQELITELQHLADADPDPSCRKALHMLASAVEYHRREDKPYWWAHFDRLTSPIDTWANSTDVVVADGIQLLSNWELPPGKRNPRRTLQITGSISDGSRVAAGMGFGTIYEHPPECAASSATGHRGWLKSATVVDVATSGERSIITVEEMLPRGGCEHSELPIALIPAAPISTKSVAEAIRKYAADIKDADSHLPEHPAVDLLRRIPPRLKPGRDLPALGDDAITAISGALGAVDRSYVAVQGPPGTGKTFVGARVIAHLVSAGWHIGITAQSHEVVENLLREVIRAGCHPDFVGKKEKKEEAREVPWREVPVAAIPQWFGEFEGRGAVLGGTAWDFVRLEKEQLDLLVIDEAGQFTMANTIAVARCAQRLLLLGDPQQLPQVSQGIHGEPVDSSALGWLLGEEETLPTEFGYFLETSYRMHPAVCERVSDHSYNGKLHSQPVTSQRELKDVEPGIKVVQVDHQGNATSSTEEAEEVVRQVRGVLNYTWREAASSSDPNPQPRSMTEEDVLVIAAYNAQVGVLREYLAEAALDDVKVGTVDKLQGQQAPVVVVSMSASAIDDVPRGMSFLLSRNRINVAASRAKWQTIIVRSPALTKFLPTTPHGMAELGAFIALTR